MSLCSYCGEPKKEHEKSAMSTTRNHVKVTSGPITAIKGTVTFVGECDKKARNSENWEL